MYPGFSFHKAKDLGVTHLSLHGRKTLCGLVIKNEWIESDNDSINICKSCRQSILSKTKDDG